MPRGSLASWIPCGDCDNDGPGYLPCEDCYTGIWWFPEGGEEESPEKGERRKRRGKLGEKRKEGRRNLGEEVKTT